MLYKENYFLLERKGLSVFKFSILSVKSVKIR